MKILVFGAGVLGCYYAVRLHQGGHSVEILARGDKLKRIRDRGIELYNPIRDFTLHKKIPGVARPSDEAYDLVLVCVQALQYPSILPLLAEIKNCKAFLFVGNNVSGFSEAKIKLGEDRVYAGFGSMGGTFKQGKIIFSDGKDLGVKERIYLGPAAARSSVAQKKRQHGIVLSLCSAFASAGIKPVYEPYILDYLYTHAASILPLAGAAYSYEVDLAQVSQDKALLIKMVRALTEAVEVLKALGIRVIPKKYLFTKYMPKGLFVKKFSRFLNTEAVKIALGGHAKVARKEMQALAQWLLEKADEKGLEAPNLRELLGKI